MLIIAKLPSGRMLQLEAEGHDTVAALKDQIYAQVREAGAATHPQLQWLSFEGTKLRDAQTLAECNMQRESEINVGLRPAASMITLNVGGVRHPVTLETLLAEPGTPIFYMFEGVRHGADPCFPGARGGAAGPDRIVEGVPHPVGPLPRCEDGSYFIDADGTLFGYIVNALRRNGEVSLPDAPERVRQLAIEARYFGLAELAAACDAAIAGVVSLPTLAAACDGGFTAADVAGLADGEVTELLQQQGVNVLLAKRIRREVAAERERVRLQAEAEAARIAALAEAERVLETLLRVGLRRLGAELSDGGLRALIGAGRAELRAVCELDAAAAGRLGLSAEDSRLVGALAMPGVSEQALTFAYCGGQAQGQGTTACFHGGGGTAHSPAVCGEVLDVVAGLPVYWKATLVEHTACIWLDGRDRRVNYVFLGVIGNAQPADGSYSDPTCFGWGAGNGVYIAGKDNRGHGGWASWQAGDVAVFKLEARRLSMRVRRLGDQTFTMDTNGAQNLRIHVFLDFYACRPTRVQLSRAEPEDVF
eukprot:COSAG06_NODE_1633_length_8855_cov_18.666971_2_plen_533_part_00